MGFERDGVPDWSRGYVLPNFPGRAQIFDRAVPIERLVVIGGQVAARK